MKPILVFLAIFFSSYGMGNAQHKGSWGIYGGLQIAQTSYSGVKGSIDVHWRQKHSIGISMAWIDRKATNMPEDYDQYRRQSWFGSGEVPEGFYIWTLSYGRYVPVDRAGTLRLHLKAGLSAGIYEGPENFQLVYHPASGGWLGGPAYSTYEYDYVTRDLYGLTLNPSVEYAPGRGFGFTVGALACVNNQRFCLAAEFGILFGRVRGRKPGASATNRLNLVPALTN
jgi:hypothetical protein